MPGSFHSPWFVGGSSAVGLGAGLLAWLVPPEDMSDGVRTALTVVAIVLVGVPLVLATAALIGWMARRAHQPRFVPPR